MELFHDVEISYWPWFTKGNKSDNNTNGKPKPFC